MSFLDKERKREREKKERKTEREKEGKKKERRKERKKKEIRKERKKGGSVDRDTAPQGHSAFVSSHRTNESVIFLRGFFFF